LFNWELANWGNWTKLGKLDQAGKLRNLMKLDQTNWLSPETAGTINQCKDILQWRQKDINKLVLVLHNVHIWSEVTVDDMFV